MAAGHLGVIERHRGSRAHPSVIRAVTPRLTGDMHARIRLQLRKIKHTHLAGGAGRVKCVTSRRS
jgi:hypothetical protein